MASTTSLDKITLLLYYFTTLLYYSNYFMGSANNPGPNNSGKDNILYLRGEPGRGDLNCGDLVPWAAELLHLGLSSNQLTTVKIIRIA